MGTITSLLERISRARGRPEHCAITVSAFGFALGTRTFAWQAVHEIWGCRIELTGAGEAFLEFIAGEDRVVVCETQSGFDALDAAMGTVFPSTADWRNAILLPQRARNRTLLYRRA